MVSGSSQLERAGLARDLSRAGVLEYYDRLVCKDV
jgi:hypothetical protein